MHAPRLPSSALILAVAALLVVGACGEGDDDGSSAATTTSSTGAPASSTSTTVAPTTTVPFAGSTSPTSLPPPAGSTAVALLQAVRTAHQETFDRVVFEFGANQVPGVDVAYGTPRAAGSGDAVAVAGGAALLVRLEPASGVDLNAPSAPPTYTGPDRVTGDTTLVTEVVRTGDFEANLEWAIGVRSQAPFSVTVLHDPARVVIDLAAP